MAYIKNPSEDICLPMRLSMRKTHCGPHDFAYHRHWERSFYMWLDRFLSSSVGRSMEYIHRKICHRRDKVSTKTPMQVLRGYVDLSKDISYRVWYNKYYFDEESILHRRPSKASKENRIVINKYKISSGWIVDVARIIKTSGARDILLQRLGPSDYERLFYPGYIEERLAYRIRAALWKTEYHCEDYVRYVDTHTQSFYERGTKDFKKYFAQREKALKKERRERIKRIREENEYILYAIEARRKEKEQKLNEVTRDRLGFAEDSFTGEFYHGQKRKKRKQLNITQTA